MIRKLKALGLAAAALFLLSAGMSPGGASAASFHSEIAPLVITGSNVGNTTMVVNAGTNTCKNVAVSGNTVNKTNEALTLSVGNFTECSFGWKGIIEMNGCDFVIHASGKLDIAGTKCLTEPIYFASIGCSVEIGPQSGLKSVTYANLGGEGAGRQIEVKFAVNGIVYWQEGLFCTEGAFATGQLSAVVLTHGKTELGAQQGFWWQ